MPFQASFRWTRLIVNIWCKGLGISASDKNLTEQLSMHSAPSVLHMMHSYVADLIAERFWLNEHVQRASAEHLSGCLTFLSNELLGGISACPPSSTGIFTP